MFNSDVAISGNVLETLEMSLINCEINLFLTFSTKFFISNAPEEIIFAIENTKTLCSSGNFNN